MWIKTVNANIQKKYPEMLFWKVEDQGYFVIEYYKPSMGGIIGTPRFADHSVYVYKLNDLSMERWMEEADALAEKVIKQYGSI